MKETISLAAARRIALAAQGFGKERQQGEVGRRHIVTTIRRLNLFQIDSVSAVVRAHYMPAFSRLGPYRPGLLDEAASGPKRALFEYWAHEASFLPVETWPLMQWRMRRAERGEGIYGGLARFGRERAGYVAEVYRRIEREGPLNAGALEGERGAGGWWGWSEAKKAVEWLFWAGRVTTASRRGFERFYDLPQRVLPASVTAMTAPDEADAHRALVERSARALGIATAQCLRDYFRLSPADMAGRIEELVEAGTLIPLSVKGWPRTAYLHRDARIPRRIEAQALLSPFDPVVWERRRTEGLFDFRYRIEIYTPAHKRQFGYYVLPFLLDEGIAARVDLRADRPGGALHALAAFAEPGAPAHTAEALASELRSMAAWLGLERIVVQPRGDLGPALEQALPGSA
jgi:uncharacterized protein